MPLDMKKFKWPVQKNKRSAWSEMDWGSWRRYSNSAFVNKGTMLAKNLAFTGLMRPIPDGENAITSLTTAENYYIYGATSGRRSHLFRYRPRGAHGVLSDMGTIGNETEVCNSLVVTKGGLIVGGTRSDKQKYAGGGIFTAKATAYHGDFIQEWGLKGSQIDIVLRPFKNEGIARLTYDPGRDVIYGITDRTGTLFIYDEKKNVIRKIGKIGEQGFSTTLVTGDEGYVYGAGFEGHLFRFRDDMKKIEYYDSFMPTFSGRGVYDEVDAMVFDTSSGLIYGGGRENGTLFTFNPADGATRFLGKPTIWNRVQALAATPDGRIYGLSGTADDLAHLFCYDPDTGLEDMGSPLATMEERWYGYRFACMVTGDDGELYMGQAERTSKLFIYLPPIKPVDRRQK